MITNALFALSLFLTTWWLTNRLISFAHKRELLDSVNERSSHSKATPRIGGLGFITVIALSLLSTLVAAPNQLLDSFTPQVLTGIFLPPILVALIGLIDDLKGLGRKLRLIAYVLASALTSFCLTTSVNLPFTTILMGGIALSLLICWHINLFNFMDGIDGIAASQAIFVLFGLYLLCPSLSNLPLFLCMPLLGFLMLNWHPAEIFMGDAGSTFLGSLISGLMLYAVLSGEIHWSTAAILTAAFWVDASWTLIYRLLSGQQWYAPHRSHSYQILSRKLHSHQHATLLYVLVNLLWLLPLAYASQTIIDYQLIILSISVLPLVIACFIIGAGNPTR